MYACVCACVRACVCACICIFKFMRGVHKYARACVCVLNMRVCVLRIGFSNVLADGQ